MSCHVVSCLAIVIRTCHVISCHILARAAKKESPEKSDPPTSSPPSTSPPSTPTSITKPNTNNDDMDFKRPAAINFAEVIEQDEVYKLRLNSVKKVSESCVWDALSFVAIMQSCDACDDHHVIMSSCSSFVMSLIYYIPGTF